MHPAPPPILPAGKAGWDQRAGALSGIASALLPAAAFRYAHHWGRDRGCNRRRLGDQHAGRDLALASRSRPAGRRRPPGRARTRVLRRLDGGARRRRRRLSRGRRPERRVWRRVGLLGAHSRGSHPGKGFAAPADLSSAGRRNFRVTPTAPPPGFVLLGCPGRRKSNHRASGRRMQPGSSRFVANCVRDYPRHLARCPLR